MIPSPHVELVRCRFRATFTRAIMNEWNGIIIGATHSRNTSQLYRVLVRESLNPATEARSGTLRGPHTGGTPPRLPGSPGREAPTRARGEGGPPPAVPMQVTKSVL